MTAAAAATAAAADVLDHPVKARLDMSHMEDLLVDRGRTRLEVRDQRVSEQANTAQ